MARKRKKSADEKLSKFYDFKFKSLSELSNFIELTPTKGIFENAPILASCDESEHVVKFSGTKSLNEANELMLGGWNDGAKSVAAYMAKSKAGRKGDAPVIYNSVVGFAPCVPAYLSGLPLNMYNQKQAASNKRIISITYNFSVHCGVSAEDMQKAAAKLFNVIVGLEKQGISTELYICFIAKKDSEQIFFSTCIKRAGRAFNLLSAVYPFVNPSMLRRHGFGVIERAGVTSKGWLASYGSPIVDTTAAECKRVGVPAENVFTYYSLKDKSEKEIAEMLK